MVQRLIPCTIAAAIAGGGAMAVTLPSGPSLAFTLSTPSLTETVVRADVRRVQDYAHYYGHPYHHHAYHHPAYHHPHHYGYYDNPNSVRHYVPKTNPYHTY